MLLYRWLKYDWVNFDDDNDGIWGYRASYNNQACVLWIGIIETISANDRNVHFDEKMTKLQGGCKNFIL